MNRETLTLDESAALTRRVTGLSMGVALTLVVIKAIVWLASGSVALLASTADSGLDLIASGVTFFAVRYAAAPPDAEHRFGHGKAEAFASLIQAGLVFASAALIGQNAIERLIRPGHIENEGWGVAVMALSIAMTGGLIAAQSHLLHRTASVAVSADRAHYAADLASNLIALIGIGAASLFHWARLDALAGLAIGAILLVGAITVFREASSQLMDHELPQAARARIIALVTEDPRITDVHQLRTRASGPVVHLQMHADLDPEISLVVAHQAVVAAEKRILDEFPAADIIIHPDPRGRAEPHGGAFSEIFDNRVELPTSAS
jgi:cation diffusion facilitator family transporter